MGEDWRVKRVYMGEILEKQRHVGCGGKEQTHINTITHTHTEKKLYFWGQIKTVYKSMQAPTPLAMLLPLKTTGPTLRLALLLFMLFCQYLYICVLQYFYTSDLKLILHYVGMHVCMFYSFFLFYNSVSLLRKMGFEVIIPYAWSGILVSLSHNVFEKK